ncbi:hypothetical protein [Paenibacillus sp. FJAT-26967]|uniref:hypothetical protein n=1 Tax=Paenibacillus sp. FJAT-26967 TaxID=1729690 RepID=UPI0008385344|nr:hypothetical protein [Paenibacillus sp. FJAT-26967]
MKKIWVAGILSASLVASSQHPLLLSNRHPLARVLLPTKKHRNQYKYSMNKNCLLIAASLVFLLGGCQDKPASSHVNHVTPGIRPSASPIASVPPETLDGTYFPDQNAFIVHDFAISQQEGSPDLVYTLRYQFGDIPAQFLSKDGHKYYFKLRFPKESSDLFVESETAAVEGPRVSGSNEIHNVDLKAKLKHGLSQDQINSLLKNKSNYVLSIYEDLDFAANVIHNVMPNNQIKKHEFLN